MIEHTIIVTTEVEEKCLQIYVSILDKNFCVSLDAAEDLANMLREKAQTLRELLKGTK